MIAFWQSVITPSADESGEVGNLCLNKKDVCSPLNLENNEDSDIGEYLVTSPHYLPTLDPCHPLSPGHHTLSGLLASVQASQSFLANNEEEDDEDSWDS